MHVNSTAATARHCRDKSLLPHMAASAGSARHNKAICGSCVKERRGRLRGFAWRASSSEAPRKKQMEPPPKPNPVMMLYWSRVITVLTGEYLHACSIATSADSALRGLINNRDHFIQAGVCTV